MLTLVPGEGCIKWTLGKVSKMLCVLVFFLIPSHLSWERTYREVFLSSSVHVVSFFCLMDNKISYLVAARTNNNNSFLSYHFLCSCPLRCWALEQIMWRGWCLISGLKLLKAGMVNFGTYLVSLFCMRFWRPSLSSLLWIILLGSVVTCQTPFPS